jgi:hypothetical protein
MNITIKPKTLNELVILAKDSVEKHMGSSKSQVVAVFDISESMRDFYRDGTVDALATRVLALGLQLDDNGEIPVYTLGDGSTRLKDLTKDNLGTFVTKEVIPLVGEGTNYAPVVNKIVNDAQEGDPMLVLLFTDGDNFDKRDTVEAIVRASKLPIFFQWYGISEDRAENFPFLEKLDTLGEKNNDLIVDNCGFSPLVLKSDVSNSDANLYDDMLKEYKDFPIKAETAGSKWSNKSQLRRRFLGIF